MKNQDAWIFISVFPNLLLSIPFETKYGAIVPYDDKRVIFLKEKYKPIAELLNSFVNDRLEKPSVLLIHKKTYSNKDDRHSAIVAFRNLIALNVILEGWVPLVDSKYYNVSTTLYSDYYDLFPLGGYGDKLYSVASPALSSTVSEAKIKYQSNYLLPDTKQFILFVDNKLFNTLINVWEDYFINKNKLHFSSSLFRSFQLAFSACKMPTDNFSTLYDYGTKVGLWISAFEILFHPGGKGKVGYKDIIAELNKYDLINQKIKRKIYSINGIQTNIVGLIYKEIYDARNDFFHGNSIEKNGLYVFKQKKFPAITRIAPIIYLMALHVFLKKNNLLLDVEPKSIDEKMVNYLMRDRIEEIFTKIVKKKISIKKVISPASQPLVSSKRHSYQRKAGKSIIIKYL